MDPRDPEQEADFISRKVDVPVAALKDGKILVVTDNVFGDLHRQLAISTGPVEFYKTLVSQNDEMMK